MRFRCAMPSDVTAIERLIERSVMEVMDDYSPEQRRCSIGPLFGVDTQLITDQTCYVIESGKMLVGCGGWSFRRTLFGGDAVASRDNTRSDPSRNEPARLRAFYVHPDHLRQGIATRILYHCETAAHAHGFRAMVLGATLTGLRFYLRHGYSQKEQFTVSAPAGLEIPLVHMTKRLLL